MSRVAFSLGFSSIEPKRRALRTIASHARTRTRPMELKRTDPVRILI